MHEDDTLPFISSAAPLVLTTLGTRGHDVSPHAPQPHHQRRETEAPLPTRYGACRTLPAITARGRHIPRIRRTTLSTTAASPISIT